jgi:hypothetical protein
LTALAACLISSATTHAAENGTHSVDLLRDPQFQNGFKIIAPTPFKKNVTGLMQPRFAKGKPAWYLCQWHSKYNLSDEKPEKPDAQTHRLANKAKTVIISSSSSHSDLVLSVDTRPEYNGKVRKNGQPWPHLLVEQIDVPIHLMRNLERIEFKIEALLLKNESEQLKGYSKGLHSAQFMLTFIVQNRNQKSPGFGDFLWFNVAMYDERTKFCDLYAAKDLADPSAKMIYAPPIKNFTQQSLHDGKWVTFSHKDISSLFREAIDLARKKGYLKKSPDPNDFAISSVILGWEVTGINDVSMRVRDFSIRVHMKQANNSMKATPNGAPDG